MSRLSFVLVLLVGLLAGGLGTLMLRTGTDDARLKAAIAEVLAKQDTGKAQQTAALDPGQINQLIDAYLMSDPSILTRMNDKLDAEKKVAERKAMKDELSAHESEIYQSADNVVLGNPKGDVTLVEMFDYNCTYCRGALPDLATLMAEDPNLKVILKQFPILSNGSVDAARVAVLVSKDPKINYWDFHQKMFAERGEVGASQALKVAAALGGNSAELMLDMNGKVATNAIQAEYALAKSLNIGGTPSYILGDEIIPGAVPIEQLRDKIANLRACGSTACPATTPNPAG
jgi:protein-disulfide isomerase